MLQDNYAHIRLAYYREEDDLALKYSEILDTAGYDLYRVCYHDRLTDLHVPSYRIFLQEPARAAAVKKINEGYASSGPHGPNDHLKRYVPRKKWKVDGNSSFDVADLTIREVAEWMCENLPGCTPDNLPVSDGDIDPKCLRVV